MVDSGASMHMVSEKDRNSAELATMRTSRSPTTVMTANGGVRTNKEPTVHVKQFGRSQENSFIVITLYQESNCTPDHLWPELWKSMGKHAKLKEKQKWSNERIHLENARKLRGIYFIDPEDTEFKETSKNARKKLETSVAPAMPCKIMKKNCGSGESNKIKTKLACTLEADESTRMRMGNSIPHHHEDHIA